jgi:hypothetical protein
MDNLKEKIFDILVNYFNSVESKGLELIMKEIELWKSSNEESEKPEKINIFYDEIKKTLLNYNVSINADNPTNVLKALNDLFNKYYDQTTKDYIYKIDDLLKYVQDTNLKLTNENKLLHRDINLLVVENEELKTKLKMLKLIGGS